MKTEYLYISLRFLSIIVAMLIITVVGYYMTSITYPFLFGLMIAFFINPFVTFFEKKARLPRFIAVILVLIMIFGLVTGLVTLLIAEIISGSNYLAKAVPKHFNLMVIYFEQFFTTQIMPIYNHLTAVFHTLDREHQVTVINYIQTTGASISENVNSAIQGLLQGTTEFLMNLPNAATAFVFSLLATFFISKDWNRLQTIFVKYMPLKALTSIRSILHDLKSAFLGYLVAQFTLISITTFIVLAGLIILKVQHPITIALIIGIVDLLPYLGTGLIFIPWIIYVFLSGDIGLTIGLSILYGIVVIQRQMMEPKILSQNIGIDPLATLVALFVGFKLFGFFGLLIGPVLLVFVRTLYRANVFHDLWAFIIGKKTT